jgi:hypothetical protein
MDIDIRLSPRVATITQRADRAWRAGLFETFAEALRAMLAADANPTTDAGAYGLGRCGACGESFDVDTERAEVVRASDVEADPNVDHPHLIIHAEEAATDPAYVLA